MKNIEISDEAFDVISSRAVSHANGSIVTYVDRLVGIKDRRSYEDLPMDIEFHFLKNYHPEKLDNAEAACAILALIWKKSPMRFETVVGFCFPDRNNIVLSRNVAELGKRELVFPIGNSGCFLFTGFEYKTFREMLHQIFITLGYSITTARSLELYVRKKGESYFHMLRYT